MPDGLFRIPSFLSGTTLIITFVAALLIFHWLLVFCWLINRLGWSPLSKRGWKIVDYIWLLVGSLALTGTLFQARQVLATSMLPNLESFVSVSTDEAKYYSSPKFYEGLICRAFVRSAFSPPEQEFKTTQEEFDNACAWAKQITERLKDVDRWAIIDTASLPKPPPATDPSIHFTQKEMYDAFDTHNLIAHKRQALQDALRRSEWEKFLAIISPLLAVIALALRITKVTGEIRLG
jgi:hypothetical protein